MFYGNRHKKSYSLIYTDSMMFKKYLAAITGAFILFNCDGFSTIQSAEFNQAQIEILPLTSFLPNKSLQFGKT